MILYQGKRYQNSKQVELIDGLRSDCFKTLYEEERITPDIVINACDVLVSKIEEGVYDSLIMPLLVEFDIPKEQFHLYVDVFKKESLEKKVEIELGSDYLELAPLDEFNTREIHPLGILFHIAAGNVDVLPAYSVIEGLLTGNINILKLPSGDRGVSVELLEELINIEPRLRDYIYVFDVPSTELDTLKMLGDISDAIIVWGGDEAVATARKMASINTKIIEWGHKLSFAYAGIDASEEDLKGIAKNIITTNQLLCSSAQGIFVDTTDRNELDDFASRFFEIFLEVQKDHIKVPFGMRSKNALELYYEEMVQKETNKKIWKKDGLSIITSDDSKLELSLLFRNVWIKMLPHEEIIHVIKPHKNHLQSVSVLSDHKYDIYKELLIQAGLVRIKKASEMSEVLLGESHDGMYPLRLYSRMVEIYNK